jgi:hypothetical protein
MHDFPLRLSRNATKTVGTTDHRNTTKYEILCRKRKTKDLQKTKNEDQNIFTWLTLWRCREGRWGGVCQGVGRWGLGVIVAKVVQASSLTDLSIGFVTEEPIRSVFPA